MANNPYVMDEPIEATITYGVETDTVTDKAVRRLIDFENGKWDLNKFHKLALDEIAASMKDPITAAYIVGHASRRGEERGYDNVKLSGLRASEVKKYLDKFVNPGRTFDKFVGATKPLGKGPDDPIDRAVVMQFSSSRV